MKRFQSFVAVLMIMVCNFAFGQSLQADMPRFNQEPAAYAPTSEVINSLEAPVDFGQSVVEELQPQAQPDEETIVEAPGTEIMVTADAEPVELMQDETADTDTEQEQQQTQTQQNLDQELKTMQQRIEEIRREQAAQQAGQIVTIKVGDVTILPPFPGYQPKLTDGEIMVAVDQIGQTAFIGQAMAALKGAKTRAEQEDAVLQFTSPDLKAKFEASHKNSPEGLMEPKDFPPMADDKEALNLAVIKQPFVDFPGWGHNPFGSPAKSWEDLRDQFSEYMVVVINRTYYPPAMKAEWVDTLKGVLKNGPDGKYSKVVNLQDWPLWQWTAGRIPGSNLGRIQGVNIRYANGPAYGLAIFLRKYGMWVIHGFPCRGNPIIPFQGTTNFSVTRIEKLPPPPLLPPPPTAKCLSADVKVVGNNVHVTVDFDNPGQLALEFVYYVDGREVNRSGSNTYDFPVENYRDGQQHTVTVQGIWNGGGFSCPAGLSSTFLVPLPPPPPPKVPCRCERAKADRHKLKRSEADQVITLTPKIIGDSSTIVSAVWTKQDGTTVSSRFVNNQLQLSGRAGDLLPTVTKNGKTQLKKGDYTFVLTVTSLDGTVTACQVTISVTGAKIWPWLLLAAVIIVVVVIIILSHGAAAPVATKIAIPVTGV